MLDHTVQVSAQRKAKLSRFPSGTCQKFGNWSSSWPPPSACCSLGGSREAKHNRNKLVIKSFLAFMSSQLTLLWQQGVVFILPHYVWSSETTMNIRGLCQLLSLVEQRRHPGCEQLPQSSYKCLDLLAEINRHQEAICWGSATGQWRPWNRNLALPGLQIGRTKYSEQVTPGNGETLCCPSICFPFWKSTKFWVQVKKKDFLWWIHMISLDHVI